MIDSIAHRGPDGRGTYTDRDLNLGHVRLSIIDTSEAGSQPMTSHDGSLVLIFNGEIYNYLELRDEYGDYPYKSRTDTEVILAAYKRDGIRCLNKFIGMFSFALWDKKSNELVCARDQLGIKPFYYTWIDKTLAFASEIRALLAAGADRSIDHEVLFHYLSRAVYDDSESTFFRGISSLPAGHVLRLKDGKVVIEQYWNLAEIADSLNLVTDPEQAREQLKHLLIDAVRLQLRSDVPIGVHLSGGLDSAAVLGLVQLVSPDTTYHAFTGAYGDPQYDETLYALSAIDEATIEHHITRLNVEDFWDTASKVQSIQEQPFGGIATMVYWKMEQAARSQGVKVILEGQGGDELFGGYRYYSQLLNPNPTSLFRTNQDGTAFRGAECISAEFCSNYSRNDITASCGQQTLRSARLRDISSHKLPRVLRFNDRMSMAFGLELRVPLLDKRLVEFSFQIPDDFLIRDELGKWIFREAVNGIVPDSVRRPQKRAVVSPQREWFRGPLKNEIRERLPNLAPVRAGFLDGKAVINSFESFCNHTEIDNSFHIWQWLNLDIWMRNYALCQ